MKLHEKRIKVINHINQQFLTIIELPDTIIFKNIEYLKVFKNGSHLSKGN